MIRDIGSQGPQNILPPKNDSVKSPSPKSSNEVSSEKSSDSFSKSSDDIRADADWNKIPEYNQRFFTHGNKVKALFDESASAPDKSNEIFQNVEDLIKGAKETVQVEMFSLTRKSVIDLLVSEQKRGISVQVITDPPAGKWAPSKQEAIDKLKEGGVEVLLYPTVEAGHPQARHGQLDHVKLLVVDGKRAIIGGMNWGETSHTNRDVNVMVEGPAVTDMQYFFSDAWVKSGGNKEDLPPVQKAPAHPEGKSSVNFITTGLEKREQTIGRTVNRAINNAKKSVYCQLYVFTSRDTVQNLIAAKERGVDVKVMVHPLKINGFAVNEGAANTLKEAGIDVKWFVPNPETRSKLHSKLGIFDDDQVIVGSANWTGAGFAVNREANVEVLDKEVNDAFTEAFWKDWGKGSDSPKYVDEMTRD